ncbi:MAG: MBL fold metallo-hydrolase [Pseudomonadota bacterium]
MARMLVPREGLFGNGEPAITWLGQAGFWIDTGQHRILIDPYLSDSLAKKYDGQLNDHKRMAPPPVLPTDLPEPDLVLITHAHTDHMDPETLGPLTERFPEVQLVVPLATVALARERTGGRGQITAVSDGVSVEPLQGLKIDVLPAAHETLERDGDGNGVFLGYGINSAGLSIYHSGDCVPFEGLDPLVKELDAAVALLPVNGRDETRRQAGIPGNFHISEAMELCESTGIPTMVPHHFGMFAFNTIEESVIDEAATSTSRPQIVKPVLGQRLVLRG